MAPRRAVLAVLVLVVGQLPLLAALKLSTTAVATDPDHVELWVDPARANGNSHAADGSHEKPFANVLQARDSLRRMQRSAQQRATVRLAAGRHHLSQTLTLDQQDSGVDFVGERGARMLGGIQIPASAFKPIKLDWLESGVFVADLFALGLNTSTLGGLANPYPRAKLELFYGGQASILARDPNIDSAYASWQWAGYGDAEVVSDTVLQLKNAKTGSLWHQASSEPDADLWLHGFWKFDWRDTYIRVAGIEPNGSAYFITRNSTTPPQYPWVNGCRFYALNALRLLDAPGEYFVSSTGKLYFYPPDGEVTQEVLVSTLPTIVKANGTSGTSFYNVTMEVAQTQALEITEAVGSVIDGCTMANVLGACASIHGTNYTILASRVHSCGGSGLSISGGDTKSLMPSGARILGNEIQNFSRIRRTYQPGIAFSGVGHYVANNSVAHGPHTGITGGGCLMLFEHNTLSNLVYGTIDAGAFYVGRSWAQRGNVVRFNTFQHIRPVEKLAQASCSQNAFYLDDQMSGWEFYGNTVTDAVTGVLLGGGRRNHLHSNHFAGNDKDIAFDDRGLTWQSKSCAENCSASMGTSCFRVALEAVNFTQPPYATMFPELVDIYAYHPCTPVGNVIEDNTYCHQGSKPGAVFIDRDEATVKGWLSSMSNNVERC